MERYSSPAIWLHWMVALLIFCTFPLGLYMADLPASPQKLQFYSWHKWVGVTIFFLVLLRLLWRAAHRPPASVPMPRWQMVASEWVHRLLYLFMVIVPVSGWLMSSAHGFQTVWFGIVPLPDLIGKDKELAETLEEVHEVLNYTMLLLFGIHLAAALKHHFVDKDGLLSRMNPLART